jgi:hypothetical protein
MPQLYLIVAVLSILLGKLKDIFANVSISDDAKKFIKYILIGLLIWYVYRIITHYVNKQNALGDENGKLAIELHNAIYAQATSFHVPFFGDYHIGNGDEAACLAISLRIKDVTQISSFYKDIYDTDLFTDLEKIMSTEELAQFNKNVSGVSGGNIPDTRDEPKNGGTTPVIIQTPLPVKVADKTRLYCKSTGKVNVRSAKDPSVIMYTVDRKTFADYETGYVGDFVKDRKEKINGKMIDYVEVDIPWFNQDLRYGLNGLIARSYLTTVKPKQ